MDRKRKIDVELRSSPWKSRRFASRFWPLVRGGNRSVSQITFRIFETNPQLFILMLPNFAELRASPGFEKFVFI